MSILYWELFQAVLFQESCCAKAQIQCGIQHQILSLFQWSFILPGMPYHCKSTLWYDNKTFYIYCMCQSWTIWHLFPNVMPHLLGGVQFPQRDKMSVYKPPVRVFHLLPSRANQPVAALWWWKYHDTRKIIIIKNRQRCSDQCCINLLLWYCPIPY